MTRLEELSRGASVKGILPDSLVTIVDVQWFGSEALDSGGDSIAFRNAAPLLHACVQAEALC
jgi:hypothetical protein